MNTTSHTTAPAAAPRFLVGALGVSGVSAIVLGLLLLIVPFVTLAAIAVMFGLQLLILGVARVVRGFRSRRMDRWVRAGHIALGVAIAALAVVCLAHPFSTAVVLLVLVGIAWIIDGAADILDAWRSAESRDSAVIGTIFGAISIVAGVIVVAQPVSTATAFAALGGTILLALGIMQLISTQRLRQQMRA